MDVPKRALKVIGIAALLVAAIGAGVWVARHFEWHAFAAQVAQMDWRWIALAVVFDVSSYVSQAARWRSLLRPIAPVSFWNTLRAIYAGLFVNEVVPMRPGEALRGVLISRAAGKGVTAIIPSMVAERLMDGLLMGVGVVMALYFAPLPDGMRHRAEWLLGAVGVALVVGAMLLRVPAIERYTLRVRGAFADRSALAFSAGIFFSQGLAFWCVMRACHLTLGVGAGLAVMLVVRLGTLVPGAPANIGTHQMSTMLGLSLFGVPQGLAAAFSMIVFAILTIPLWLIGMVALATAGVRLSGLVPSYRAASR